MTGSHASRARLALAAISRIDSRRSRGNVIVAVVAVLLGLAPALLLPAPALAAPPSPKELTVQEVLAKSIAARGGLQQLHAVETRRESGTLELGPGNVWPLTIEHKRPNRMRMEISLQGTKLIRVFDGVHGWQKQPQSPAPEALSADDLHNIANEADFDNVLVDTAAKGKAVLLGKEPAPAAGAGHAAGTAGAAAHDVYRVQVTLLGGDVFIYSIDAVSFLPVHWEGGRTINGKLVTFVSDYNDYREVGGTRYAFQIVSSIKGSAQNQKLTYSKIELNVPIEDARFTPATMMPAAPPAAAPSPVAPAAPAGPPGAAPTPAPKPAPTPAPKPAPASPPPAAAAPPPAPGAAQPPPAATPPPPRGRR